MSSLADIRAKLDTLDEKLVSLLNERAALALQVRDIKKQSDAATYAPVREQQIIDQARSRSELFPSDTTEHIMRAVLSATRALVGETSVALAEPRFSTSEHAARQRFGAHISLHPQQSIKDVFEAVESGASDFGIVPVETAAEGLVLDTFNMILQSDLRVIGEVETKYELDLVSQGHGLERIEHVFAELEYVSLCRKWLRSNVPSAQTIVTASTQEAVERAKGTTNSAAISPAALVDDESMRVLASRIADDVSRLARLFVIGKEVPPASGSDRTSLVCSVKERAGALMDVLRPFADENITLTKIESKPMRTRAWDYVFFIDALGHYEEAHIKRAVDKLEPACSYLRVLGSYPVATS